MISPARTEQLFCELQITTGPDNLIRMLAPPTTRMVRD